jgi:hypothetical protein
MFYEGGVVLCSAMCECRQRVGLGQTRGGVLDERPGVSSKDVQGGLRQMYSGSGGAEYTAEVCTRGRGQQRREWCLGPGGREGEFVCKARSNGLARRQQGRTVEQLAECTCDGWFWCRRCGERAGGRSSWQAVRGLARRRTGGACLGPSPREVVGYGYGAHRGRLGKDAGSALGTGGRS